jgi:hypothetical protein
MKSPWCLCICEPPRINFWMPEPILLKFGMCIMAHEAISTAYFINPSHPSVSVCVSFLTSLRKRSVKTLPQQRTHATIEELLDASFSMRSLTYERKWAINFSQNFLLACFLYFEKYTSRLILYLPRKQKDLPKNCVGHKFRVSVFFIISVPSILRSAKYLVRQAQSPHMNECRSCVHYFCPVLTVSTNSSETPCTSTYLCML